MTLFDPGPAEADPDAGLSPTRRRTLARRRLLDAGIHPATKAALAAAPHGGAGETCGTCLHHLAVRSRAGRVFHKCRLVGDSASEATDIRTGWPACVRWLANPS
jgi:hypothetical protein